ncbi:PREDICTED: discoidin, CUB and LCCL domain-containing protein 2-like [Branchiostoma belcheri]|uniref:Discoidin, CUB and LCCL domain-containing protein 2-like n=1 Tax=Branchiostoma belcheri TaxID=7741 RepID=A0A6P4ZJW2_BRABE|nr:PREDICTED: discoidin, CUB and LCCL domain-containing protein 2-like [Branchiostoma belcheri]
MTASSQLTGSEAYRGRLNGDGAWQPTGQQEFEALAVDLGKKYYIFGIQTQGQGDGYVETYRFVYQPENSTELITYSEDGVSAKIFTGNFDNETIVQQNFTSYIHARYILVNPETFSGAPRLRIELLGVNVVYQPIGVQDKNIIRNDQMTASSQLNGSESYRGRLNGDGAWQLAGQDVVRYLAVDLEKMYYVFGIQTQGQGDGYVETFRILYQTDSSPQLIGYSEDGVNPKIFTGNFDNETIVQQNFTSYILTRVIVVNPRTFSGAPRLRIELLGVEELPTTSLPTTRHPWTTTKSPVTSPLFTTSATTLTSSAAETTRTTTKSPETSPLVTTSATTLTSSAAETTSSSHLYPSTERF